MDSQTQKYLQRKCLEATLEQLQQDFNNLNSWVASIEKAVTSLDVEATFSEKIKQNVIISLKRLQRTLLDKKKLYWMIKNMAAAIEAGWTFRF